ncbi:MAG: transketolase family protein [Candidatus Aenigmatarchaeota archaeon]|nr:MAG: transketolase family protein [Candidatus Aenigmarchaeota archaeon]
MKGQHESMRSGLGRGAVEAAKTHNIRVYVSDLGNSMSLADFAAQYPRRIVDAGIAEQDSVTMAAGAAHRTGERVYYATFEGFSKLAAEPFEQIVRRAKLNVCKVGSHVGLQVGQDGVSNQVLNYLSYNKAISDTVLCPADWVEAKQMTVKLANVKDPKYAGPATMSMTRAEVLTLHDDNWEWSIGKGEVLRDGDDVAIMSYGALIEPSLGAAALLEGSGVSAAVINISSIKPIDSLLIEQYARKTGLVVTAEDHSIDGGLGSSVSDVLSERYPTHMRRIGAEKGETGSPKDLYRKAGFTPDAIAERVAGWVEIRHKDTTNGNGFEPRKIAPLVHD